MQFFVSCIRGRPMVAPTYCNPIYTVQTKIYRFISEMRTEPLKPINIKNKSLLCFS